MTIVHLTPGAGAMYCGACLRDNALVMALRKLGHDVLMVPLYLPLTLDEPDQSATSPIFFSGLNVYLQQKSVLFRQAPAWLHRLLTARPLLKWASGRAAKTRAQDLGELTLSMLRGEEGNQARELVELLGWVKTQPKPDIICLSNALLLGVARRLKSELDAPVVCCLQGEDWFLEALPEPHRGACLKALAEKAAAVELFIAPSRYFADRMIELLDLRPERVRVVYNGINLEGYAEVQSPDAGPQDQETTGPRFTLHAPRSTLPTLPTLGFFARMCPEKGLDTLVAAYIRLRQRGRVGNLRLRIGGSCGPADERFVDGLREQLRQAGLLGETEFCPNLDREAKLAFLKSLTVFSVPAAYGEAFGLYVIEALAAGVPVVQPRSGAFPELLEATGGGVLCAPGDAQALAEEIEGLLEAAGRMQALGEAGRRAVFAKFNAGAMAQETLKVYGEAEGIKAGATGIGTQVVK
jgi:glycosyltransferase involved in cell wall biosynthesis